MDDKYLRYAEIAEDVLDSVDRLVDEFVTEKLIDVVSKNPLITFDDIIKAFKDRVEEKFLGV